MVRSVSTDTGLGRNARNPRCARTVLGEVLNADGACTVDVTWRASRRSCDLVIAGEHGIGGRGESERLFRRVGQAVRRVPGVQSASTSGAAPSVALLRKPAPSSPRRWLR